ncbi:MAG: acyltransferase [Anaerolineae bacterium]|nr:acyltransferase [Anaerolineae bacterium]
MAEATTHAAEPPTKNNGRIHYIDGVRAFAALAVVVLHILQMRGLRLETAGVIPGFDYSGALTDGAVSDILRIMIAVFLNLGTLAVKVFIVISGYTIMISVVKSKDGMPKGGLKGYMQRRIKRIWPPYYAALAISILIILLIPGMNELSFNRYHDVALPLSLEAVVSHALFIHTWFPQYAQTINTPMWSIAVEEQIYILFPLVLLPFWRSRNSLFMLLSAMVVGWLPMLFLPLETYHSTRAWFLILFALGATGVSINFSNRPQEIKLRERIPWAPLGIGLLGAWFVATKIAPRLLGIDDTHSLMRLEAFTDILFGGAWMAFFIHLTEVWKVGIPKRSFLAVFNSRPAVTLGLFSYSIYLMHVPILSVLTMVLMRMGVDGELLYILLFVIGFPLAIGLTYLFHLAFERPFMPQAAKQLPAAASGFQPANQSATGD